MWAVMKQMTNVTRLFFLFMEHLHCKKRVSDCQQTYADV